MQKIEFPLYLDSYRGNEPEDTSDFKFVNYFPKEQSLRSNISKVNTDWQDIESKLNEKMKQLVDGFLKNQQGSINIYPKKNTIDLKKLYEKRTENLRKKTEKAVIFLLRKKLKKDDEPSEDD